MFKTISRHYLKTIAVNKGRLDGTENTPTLYFHPNPLVRYFFWMRLKLASRKIEKFSSSKGSACDFGGGNGVFLPTLATIFKKVDLLDLDTQEAEQLVADFQLSNVSVRRDNALTTTTAYGPYDCITACDVLEHFKDVEGVIGVLKRFLAPDGLLVTSLPTENFVYTFLRAVFRVTKPWDHYHTAEEVERTLVRMGFKKISGSFVPCYFNLFPLFRVSAWKKQ